MTDRKKVLRIERAIALKKDGLIACLELANRTRDEIDRLERDLRALIEQEGGE